MSRGIFITMEGPDGSGKSTQIALLKEYLEKEGYDVIITREPGGTKISENIREVILNPDYKEMSSVTEMMLYASARAQLIAEVIGPAIDSGKAVISDRFVDSSLVYQGMARGLGVEKVLEINKVAIGDYMPDVTFMLDLPAETGIARKKDQKELDRMEQESLDFHRSVAEGYRQMAARFPERIKTIDATLPIEEICGIIKVRVKSLLDARV
ncbi:MAG: dTMP kinase [Eubacterium sp.]|nr:dTMP kinase [Eubacterium sp.]MCR4847083.1 dTMP kinase [Eubacterium sp.]